MTTLMITWTDVFEGIGSFFEWIFRGMYKLGHMPNVCISAFVIFLLAYWTLRLVRYKKEAKRNGTIE